MATVHSLFSSLRTFSISISMSLILCFPLALNCVYSVQSPNRSRNIPRTEISNPQTSRSIVKSKIEEILKWYFQVNDEGFHGKNIINIFVKMTYIAFSFEFIFLSNSFKLTFTFNELKFNLKCFIELHRWEQIFHSHCSTQLCFFLSICSRG